MASEVSMSSAAIIPWERRSDLVVRPRRDDDRGGCVVKDPIALRFYQLGEEEQFLWSRLDGRQSVAALCAAFAERFLPRQLSPEELQRFVAQLVSMGLVISRQPGTAALVAHRRERTAWLQRIPTLTNVLAIRFRGVNPDRWLTHALPTVDWCFSRPAAIAAGTLVLSALLLVLLRFNEFLHRWPEEIAQWTAQDAATLAVLLGTTKILHELGHAFACKRSGGHVPELGVMLLIFTPCLYCNVSDAWLLRSRRQRMLIGAAGMIVEVVLAAAATWLWWWSAPGTLHVLSLQLALMCGVNTLLINGNPLLRYDGYFLLSDALDIPNLQQQSNEALGRLLRPWLTGVGEPLPRGRSRALEQGLRVYAVLAGLYRLLVLFGILWLVDHWLEPQGYRVLAQGIMLATITTVGWGWLWGGIALWGSITSDPERRPRAIRRGLIGLGLGLFLFWLPIPHRVAAPIVIEPREARGLHVTLGGRLEQLVAPGTVVQAGDPIARLTNPMVERAQARATANLERATQTVQTLERRRIADAQASIQLPAALSALDDARQRFHEQATAAARLTLTAPCNGTFFSSPARAGQSNSSQLPFWSGDVGAPRNTGCWLEPGTTLGVVGDGSACSAIAYLPQSEVADLAIGQTVRVSVETQPGAFLTGRVVELAAARTPTLPGALALRLKLPAIPTAEGAHLVGTWYRARIDFDQTTSSFVRQAAGTASFVVPPQSLATRIQRWWSVTFPSF